MKRWLGLLTALMVAVLVTACGGEVATKEVATGTLTEDHEDATSVRNQLALGILRLEGTPQAIGVAQAEGLLPLWQMLQTLGASSTAAPTEMEALQTQIQDSLTEDQVAAIAALKLTNADLQAYYVEIGLTELMTPEPGITPQGGALKDLSQEQREAVRATAQAQGTPVGNRGGIGAGNGASKRDALLDQVIALLTERAGGR